MLVKQRNVTQHLKYTYLKKEYKQHTINEHIYTENWANEVGSTM